MFSIKKVSTPFISILFLISLTVGCGQQAAEPHQESHQVNVSQNNIDVSTTQGSYLMKSAPSFTLPELETKKDVSLNDLLKTKKYTLLHIWASWCQHCKNEDKSLVTLKGKYTRQVQFISVNMTTHDNLKDVKKYVSNNEYSSINLLDTKDTFQKSYKIGTIPADIMLAPDGRIVGYHIGEMTQSQLNEFFAKSLSAYK